MPSISDRRTYIISPGGSDSVPTLSYPSLPSYLPPCGLGNDSCSPRSFTSRPFAPQPQRGVRALAQGNALG